MTSDTDSFVFVALPGQSDYVVAGRFRISATSDGDPLGEFVYGRSYLSRPDAVAFDPVQLRLAERVRKTRSFNGLFGAIRDAMPAAWGGLQHERCGALAFSPRLEPPRPRDRFAGIDDLTRLQAAFDDESRGRDACRETDETRAMGSVSRRRPVATVADGRALWLAKFARRHTVWNQTRVRHATLRLARECGLDTMHSRIERIPGNDILLLRRYDREWVGDGYACSRVITGLTFLRTDDTPAEKRRWSYLTLADEVRRVSSHPREDLRELFGRICFNAAISNLADDMRLPMMVAKGNRWRLAPATGLAPTPSVDAGNGDLAMICGPAGRSPSRENIVGGAGRFLLDRAAAEAIFDGIFETVRSSWYDVMRRSGVSAEDCELVGRSIVPGSDDS